jgi:hypothetical protein
MIQDPGVLDTYRQFQPSLMFVSKARAQFYKTFIRNSLIFVIS